MMQSKMLVLLACVGASSAAPCALVYDVVGGSTVSDPCKAHSFGVGATTGLNQDGVFVATCPSGDPCYLEDCGAPSSTLPKCKLFGSGTQINPGPSAPSSATTLTGIEEGMVGFTDMDDSRFYNFPPTMLMRYAQMPTVRTLPNYKMEMGCSAGQGGAGGYCDHFVVAYSCATCQYEDGGNIHAILLSLGFKPFRCGTVMDLDVNVDSFLHNMVVYHKQTLQGNKDVITAPALMEFTFFAFSPASAYCGQYTDETLCWNTAVGECSWNNGVCERDLCPKQHKSHGPWVVADKCRVCPHDPSEDRFIPTII